MRVVHEASDEPLATRIDVADSFLTRARGLMFRRSIPDDYGLVFTFDGQSSQDLHMVFVPFDIDAVWLTDGIVQAVKRLPAWTGRGKAVADTIIELPAGAADGVKPGDRVRIE
ncbi:MAG: DUF192 domain-containing protein [Halobacteriales archaeon]|nr:DUF192 domain-containing protein [Halobacteriales archaeon]